MSSVVVEELEQKSGRRRSRKNKRDERNSRTRFGLVLRLVVILTFAILYVGASSPLILNSSLQNAAYTLNSVSISYSQVPRPFAFYLSPGSQYSLVVVQEVGHGETFAILTTQQQSPVSQGELVYISSQSQEWYVQSNPDPIPAGGLSYDRIVLGSIGLVSNSAFTSAETWLQTPNGQFALQISTILSYVGPAVFVLAMFLSTRRFSWWTIPTGVLFYGIVSFLPGLLGLNYGMSISTAMAAALAGLVITVFLTDKAQNYARGRIAATSTKSTLGK